MRVLAKDGGGMLVTRPGAAPPGLSVLTLLVKKYALLALLVLLVTRPGAAPQVLSVIALPVQKYKYGRLSSSSAAQEDGTGYWQAHR
jgi:hypothetical protein